MIFLTCVMCEDEKKKEDIIIPVKVKEITFCEGSRKNYISGQVMPIKLSNLSFKVSGKIKKIFVEEGQFVRKEQKLAILDEADYKLQMNITRDNLKVINKEFERRKTLLKKGYISKAEYDQYETKRDVAAHQYELAMKQLQYTILKSPFDGIIARKQVEDGEMVSPDRVAFILTDISKVKVRAGVPDVDVVNYSAGKDIDVIIPAVKTEPFKGKIFSIGIMPDPESRTYPIEVHIENQEKLIKPLMIADLVISKNNSKELICVPLNVIRKNEFEEPIVFVVDREETKAVERNVKLGKGWRDKIEVIYGLKNGDRLIVAGHHYVENGSRVKVVN